MYRLATGPDIESESRCIGRANGFHDHRAGYTYMADSQVSRSNGRELLSKLAGRPCPYCPDGELTRDVYKDNEAVVCNTCETPHVQVW